MKANTRYAAKNETKRENIISKKPMKEFSPANQSPVDQVLHLQRTMGNRVVTQLIKSGVIQAKLKIGPANDKYEQEADRVADQVMSMEDRSLFDGHLSLGKKEKESSLVQRESNCPECEEKETEGIQTKPLAEQITPLVQRENIEEDEENINPKLLDNQQIQREEGPEDEKDEIPGSEVVQPKGTPGETPRVTPNIEAGINAMKGGGQPLSESTRSFFEPRFGRDFRQVRVHTDSKAAQTAQTINAKAFTTGKDIVFNSGQYSPGTSSGKSILAHELTHVVQQGARKKPGILSREIKIHNQVNNRIQKQSAEDIRRQTIEWPPRGIRRFKVWLKKLERLLVSHKDIKGTSWIKMIAAWLIENIPEGFGISAANTTGIKIGRYGIVLGGDDRLILKHKQKGIFDAEVDMGLFFGFWEKLDLKRNIRAKMKLIELLLDSSVLRNFRIGQKYSIPLNEVKLQEKGVFALIFLFLSKLIPQPLRFLTPAIVPGRFLKELNFRDIKSGQNKAAMSSKIGKVFLGTAIERMSGLTIHFNTNCRGEKSAKYTAVKFYVRLFAGGKFYGAIENKNVMKLIQPILPLLLNISKSKGVGIQLGICGLISHNSLIPEIKMVEIMIGESGMFSGIIPGIGLDPAKGPTSKSTYRFDLDRSSRKDVKEGRKVKANLGIVKSLLPDSFVYSKVIGINPDTARTLMFRKISGNKSKLLLLRRFLMGHLNYTWVFHFLLSAKFNLNRELIEKIAGWICDKATKDNNFISDVLEKWEEFKNFFETGKRPTWLTDKKIDLLTNQMDVEVGLHILLGAAGEGELSVKRKGGLASGGSLAISYDRYLTGKKTLKYLLNNLGKFKKLSKKVKPEIIKSLKDIVKLFKKLI